MTLRQNPKPKEHWSAAIFNSTNILLTVILALVGKTYTDFQKVAPAIDQLNLASAIHEAKIADLERSNKGQDEYITELMRQVSILPDKLKVEQKPNK